MILGGYVSRARPHRPPRNKEENDEKDLGVGAVQPEFIGKQARREKMTRVQHRMNRRDALIRGGVVGAGALAALLPTVPVAADVKGSASLVGAWRLAFAISGGPALQVLEIFTGAGEVVGVSSSPPSSGSAALGAWRRAGDDTYLNTHEFFQFDPAGNFTGTTRIRARLTVTGNELSGQAHIDFEPAGSADFIRSVGAASITGSRVVPLPV